MQSTSLPGHLHTPCTPHAGKWCADILADTNTIVIIEAHIKGIYTCQIAILTLRRLESKISWKNGGIETIWCKKNRLWPTHSLYVYVYIHTLYEFLRVIWILTHDWSIIVMTSPIVTPFCFWGRLGYLLEIAK